MSSFSRRDFVLAASSAAAAGMAGCASPAHGGASALLPQTQRYGGASNDLISNSGTVYDVIIVGAGAAGIGAARMALSYGRSVVLLEAQNRAGGRAKTDNTTFSEVGFDLGAQFFGHVLSGNVLFGIAQSRGIPVVDFTKFPTAMYRGAKRASLVDQAGFVATAGDMLSSLLAAGASITGPSTDFPVSRVTSQYFTNPYYQNAIGVLTTTETGAEPRESSMLDLYNFMLGSPSPFLTPGDSFLVKSGMGNFIEGLANGLPVHLNTTVLKVTRTSSGVTVTTDKGTYTGKTVIVTVSTGVLGAGAIEFSPALPTKTQEAIAGIPLGVVYKAALGFSSDIFPAFKTMTPVTQLSTEPAVTYFAKFWNYNIVEFLADADLAKKIESMTKAGQANYLLGRLEENFPGVSAYYDGRIAASNWGRNLHTYGSYSYAKPGMSEARRVLAQNVGGKIFFAGEAVAQSSTITLLQGAYNSGIAAASGALKAIGVQVRA